MFSEHCVFRLFLPKTTKILPKPWFSKQLFGDFEESSYFWRRTYYRNISKILYFCNCTAKQSENPFLCTCDWRIIPSEFSRNSWAHIPLQQRRAHDISFGIVKCLSLCVCLQRCHAVQCLPCVSSADMLNIPAFLGFLVHTCRSF